MPKKAKRKRGPKKQRTATRAFWAEMKREIAKGAKRRAKAFAPYLAEVQLPEEYEHLYPFHNGDIVLMLGEIANMRGHMVFALKDGRVLFGYHPEHFRKLTEEEA